MADARLGVRGQPLEDRNAFGAADVAEGLGGGDADAEIGAAGVGRDAGDGRQRLDAAELAERDDRGLADLGARIGGEGGQRRGGGTAEPRERAGGFEPDRGRSVAAAGGEVGNRGGAREIGEDPGGRGPHRRVGVAPEEAAHFRRGAGRAEAAQRRQGGEAHRGVAVGEACGQRGDGGLVAEPRGGGRRGGADERGGVAEKRADGGGGADRADAAERDERRAADDVRGTLAGSGAGQQRGEGVDRLAAADRGQRFRRDRLGDEVGRRAGDAAETRRGVGVPRGGEPQGRGALDDRGAVVEPGAEGADGQRIGRRRLAQGGERLGAHRDVAGAEEAAAGLARLRLLPHPADQPDGRLADGPLRVGGERAQKVDRGGAEQVGGDGGGLEPDLRRGVGGAAFEEGMRLGPGGLEAAQVGEGADALARLRRGEPLGDRLKVGLGGGRAGRERAGQKKQRHPASHPTEPPRGVGPRAAEITAKKGNASVARAAGGAARRRPGTRFRPDAGGVSRRPAPASPAARRRARRAARRRRTAPARRPAATSAAA